MKRVLMVGLMLAGSITTAMAAQAETNPWMIRGRVIGVLPDEGADLKVGGGALPGTVDISDQYVPELDITYFFTDHIAAELILGVTPHDVKATGVTVPGVLTDATVDLGDVWLLPPTLTLQYHFDTGTPLKPYVGAGVNATFFFDEDAGKVADGIEYDPTIGFALQAGADYDLDGEPGGWALNVDVKKVWIEPDVKVDLTSALGPSLNANRVVVDADVEINPVIVGVGLGYKF
ncbi:OmpW family outer membrane protein [Henriciella sp. AS95]|uniref:OmpW/AlkL family protein n=1 Tax=Henriciella sp. AS95 TaxID=3135782 RepID=UPI00316B5E70